MAIKGFPPPARANGALYTYICMYCIVNTSHPTPSSRFFPELGEQLWPRQAAQTTSLQAALHRTVSAQCSWDSIPGLCLLRTPRRRSWGNSRQAMPASFGVWIQGAHSEGCVPLEKTMFGRSVRVPESSGRLLLPLQRRGGRGQVAGGRLQVAQSCGHGRTLHLCRVARPVSLTAARMC